MDKNDELYKAGLLLHGHKCPAMPMGLRAGLAALEALGVPRAADGQLTALIEIDSEHCATCYADGIQMATGCTFGKGNIRKLGYGKFVLTLVDDKTGRSVRVATRNEVIKRNQESEFIQYRKQGVPASKIDLALVEPNIDFILAAADRGPVQDRAGHRDQAARRPAARLQHHHLRRVRRGGGRALCPRQERADRLHAVRGEKLR